MALNPPLNEYGDPWRVEGEFFMMQRKDVEFEFKVKNGNTYSGKGKMILTTCRLIAINQNKSKFKAFDIPLALVSDEGFKQPIFGANYLCGTCQPLANILPGPISFKFWFMAGGCGTFAPAYLKSVMTMRRNKTHIDQKMLNAVKSGNFKSVAYMDPNDPSVIYMEQPQINQNPQQQGFGYAQYVPGAPQPFSGQGVVVGGGIPPQYQQQQQPQVMNNVQVAPMPQNNYQPIPQKDVMEKPQINVNNMYMPQNNNNVNNNMYMPQNNNNVNNNMYMPQNNNNVNNNMYTPNQVNNQGQQNYMGQNTGFNYNNNFNNNNNIHSLNDLNNNNNENNYPELSEINQSSNNYAYPQGNNIQNLNNVNLQQPQGPRYFYFFGPQLQVNPENMNNNNNNNNNNINNNLINQPQQQLNNYPNYQPNPNQ